MRSPLHNALLVALLSIGGAAVVTGGAGVAREPAAPSLAVEQQGDSMRVVAAWKPACNPLGCSDAARIEWRVNQFVVATRTRATTADTLWHRAPPYGDSLRVVVTVTAIRRGISGEARSASAWLVRRDAPPPPVDSLRVDTLALRLALEQAAIDDSFPVIAVRDTLGRSSGDLPLGMALNLCALSRNRYTGRVTIMVPPDAPAWADTSEARRCELARTRYEAERSG